MLAPPGMKFLTESLIWMLPYQKNNHIHCVEAKLKHKRMGTLRFYIPGFHNWSQLSKTKTIFEIHLRKLETIQFVLSDEYSVVWNNRAAHFINFWLFFLSTRLIRNCTFINFADKFLPARLFGTNNSLF